MSWRFPVVCVRQEQWARRASEHANDALYRARVGLSFEQWIGRVPRPGRQPGPMPVGRERKRWPMALDELAPDYALRH